MTVLIAGAGIAGLSLGLTLHEIGVPFRIFEATAELKPLGIGINIQPNAVRELYEMGFENRLDEVGIKTRQYGFYSKLGNTIWEEPRGQWAESDSVITGARASGFETATDGAALHLADGRPIDGDLLIAADGIHSAIRAQLAPHEGPPIWDGAILWRATSQARPFFGGAAMALIGHDSQRLVAYPISAPDPDTGLATMNWIAELRVDPNQGWNREDWNRAATVSDFLPAFEAWQYDWPDSPALIRAADKVYEYPLVDRDPLDQLTNNCVTLMGDAAHPTYPVGSNGSTQAIIDARVLGAKIRDHGPTTDALLAYEADRLPATNTVTLANRGSGPEAILQKIESRSGDAFDTIDDVIPAAELAAHTEAYESVAGLSIDALNASPSILTP